MDSGEGVESQAGEGKTSLGRIICISFFKSCDMGDLALPTFNLTEAGDQ